jgi:hypothetical protein
LLSDQQLKRTIANLKTMERERFESRQRFGFIVYLSAVLKVYSQLKRKRIAKISVNRIAKVFGIRTQKRTHPIRIIIDATSASDSKAKSRASRALRYAWREREQWTDLGALFSQVGGVAGAAARWSALRSRDRNRQVGPDMQDLVPEVPLIVDVPLVEAGQLFSRAGRVYRQPDAREAESTSKSGNEATEKCIKRDGLTSPNRLRAQFGRSGS